MFRSRVLYFSQSGGRVRQGRTLIEYQRKLLFALETARTRLAVAIASETKSTPLERWRDYYETAERTRRFIKKLRNANFETPVSARQWTEAVESLRHFSSDREAARLCKLLEEIVAKLE
jgi:hypothetical protein